MSNNDLILQEIASAVEGYEETYEAKGSVRVSVTLQLDITFRDVEAEFMHSPYRVIGRQDDDPLDLVARVVTDGTDDVLLDKAMEELQDFVKRDLDYRDMRDLLDEDFVDWSIEDIDIYDADLDSIEKSS